MSLFKYGVGQGANYLNSATPPPGYAPPVSGGGGMPGWLSALGASELPGGGFGGNKSFRVGNDVYTGAYTPGDVDHGVGAGYVGDFYKYGYNPQAWAGKGSVLNGTDYERFNTAGKSLGMGKWEGIEDKDFAMDNAVVAIVGSILGGAALAGTGAAGAGAAGAGEGAVGAGVTGFGDAGLMYGGANATAAGTLGGGYSVAGGSALGAAGGAGALGAGAAGMGGGGGAGGAMSGFSWDSLVGPATQLIGGALGASAAKGASNDQLQAAREAAALFEPWRQAGSWAIGQGANMLGRNGPEAAKAAFQTDPGYQWRLSQGENALTRAASARGMLGSGKYLKDAMNYNQGQASQEFGSSLNRLLAVAGMGQTATNSAADYGTQGANAAAAGRVGAANAWTNALSQGASMYSNNQQMNQNNALMNRYLTGRGV